MLTFFRRGLTEKIMLVVLVISLFAIVVTGFGTGGMGGIGELGTSGSVASVEGETITQTEIADQINRQLARARQQQPELTTPQFLAGGNYERIVQQLITQKAITAFARDHGLAASKRMIDGEIASIPAFQNLAGQFDETVFRSALRGENMNEARLREELAGSLITRQLLVPVAASVRVPQSIAQQYASLLLEQRTGSIGLVPTAAMGRGREPTEQEVATFFRDNANRYVIPERRVIRYAAFGREQLGQAAEATPAEIQAFYKANQNRYGPSETRTLSQVVLPDQAAARAFAAKLAAGTSFAAAAAQAGFQAADTSIGAQSKSGLAELASPAVANAAFAAAEGATTAPLQSPLGWHIVKVEAIARTPARPLAAVSAEIEREVEGTKAEEALANLVTRIEDALADGSSLEEVARAERLTLAETPPVTATGAQPGVAGAVPDPAIQPLLKPAFEMEADEDPEVQQLAPGQRYALFAIGQVIPAAPPALASIRDRVKADLVARRGADRARAVATAIAAKINAGTPPRQAFAEAGASLPPVQTVTARRIDIAQPNKEVPPPLALMFSLPQGRARLLPAPSGAGWFVVHHGSSTPGDARSAPGLIEATRTQFQNILGEEYAAQFTRAIERNVSVKRDEEAIRKVKAQLTGAGNR
jgi:peptidyl-prolyl cis-trans isomerase D